MSARVPDRETDRSDPDRGAESGPIRGAARPGPQAEPGPASSRPPRRVPAWAVPQPEAGRALPRPWPRVPAWAVRPLAIPAWPPLARGWLGWGTVGPAGA